MEANIMNFEIIAGKVIPTLVFLFVAWGMILTDIAQVHRTLLFLGNNKALTVMLAGLPIAAVYIATGTHWESVLITYTVANTFYSVIVKPLKSKIK